jgi:MFS superfamily sulfate permease-like transporter
MYYANCAQFKAEIRELAIEAQPPLSWFCVDLAAVDDIDFSAAETFRDTYALLKQRGIRLVCVEVLATARAELDRYGIAQLIGAEYIFGRIHEVEAAYAHVTARSTA